MVGKSNHGQQMEAASGFSGPWRVLVVSAIRLSFCHEIPSSFRGAGRWVSLVAAGDCRPSLPRWVSGARRSGEGKTVHSWHVLNEQRDSAE